MRDCENVDVRERLPELLHERLVGAERERVLAHLDECADCAAELALLRSARAVVVANGPRIDAASIARAVQLQLAATRTENGVIPIARPTERRRPLWSSTPLRAAAAVVLMAMGAGGVLVARRDGTSVSASRDTVALAAPTPSAAVPATAVATAPVPTPPRVDGAPGSALGATFADLTDDELAAVLEAIDGTDGSLPADPAPTPSVVNPDDGEGAL
jgi:hypothetical protein